MESLNFDKLISAYYENLNSKLRNFYTGPEFLDSWVHDENLNRSVLGIFESAQDNGVNELSLEVSESLSKDIDIPLLEQELKTLGSPVLERTNEGYRVSLRKTHPAYQKELAAREKKIQFEGTVSGGYTAKEGQLEISCSISERQIIMDARHRGGIGFFRPLLDTLCKVLVGRPLQEGQDHALVRVEALLRDPSIPPPVQGLVTFKNCDPAFRVLEALVRKLGPLSDKRNEWVDGIRPEWKELSFDEQKIKIQPLLEGTDLEVLEIRHSTRVVLSGNAFRVSKYAGHELMLLERKAKELLEPNLEFVMESLEDKNKRELR